MRKRMTKPTCRACCPFAVNYHWAIMEEELKLNMLDRCFVSESVLLKAEKGRLWDSGADRSTLTYVEGAE